jgi:hypothetical protein
MSKALLCEEEEHTEKVVLSEMDLVVDSVTITSSLM